VNAATTQSNVAEVTAVDQFDCDSTPNNSVTTEDDHASVSLTPKSADLSLTKTVNDATPSVGDNVTFTVMVSNAGPDAATTVAVQDLLPSGLTFVSASSANGPYDSTTGAWTISSIANGATASLQIVATVASTADTTNSAQVSAADQRDPDSTVNNNIASEDDQASVSLTPLQIDLSLAKTVSDASSTRLLMTARHSLARAGRALDI